MSRSLRVLLVSPYFPPRRRVGSLRPFKLAKYLPEHGIETAVVALHDPGSLTEREWAALEGTPVLRLRPWLDRTTRRSTSSLEREQAKSSSRSQRLLDAVDRALPVDAWWPFLAANASRALGFARELGADAVLATGDPWSSLWLGAYVAEGLGVPAVFDLRDPWTLCPVRGRDRARLARAIDARVERSMLGRAAAVTFTAEAARERYARAYPSLAERFAVVTNGYDAEPLDDVSGCEARREELTLLFFGAFRPLAPARPLLEALFTLRERRPDALAQIRVECVGGLVGGDRALAERLGLLDRFVSIDPVPYERALERQRRCDALLVVADPSRDDMVPAKLLDALPTGRPVLSFGTGPDVARILAETGVGEAARGAADGARLLEDALHARAAGALRERFGPRDRAAIGRYHARAIAARFAEILRRVRA